MTTPASSPASRALRMLVGALLAAPLLMLVALLFVLPVDDATYPPPLTIALLLAPVVLAWLLVEAVGFRAAPIDPSQPAPEGEVRATSLGVMQRLTILRFAVAEVPLLLGLAASFVLPDHALWPYVIVLPPALALMAWTTWPSRRNVDRTAAALEARGGRSFLREAFDHA